eukprot:TRINITY_DN961_c0_g2_i1.p1 TRINITY_DN961_c0_g2~~TRINITY_DN961_c0_g2_i1.p1  ORF type:complete len:132 (+),score=27.46 TRINITY_DN961_c0_g2_i1:100-495(+)
MSKKLAQSSLGLLDDLVKQSKATGKSAGKRRQARTTTKATRSSKLSMKEKQSLAERKVLEKLERIQQDEQDDYTDDNLYALETRQGASKAARSVLKEQLVRKRLDASKAKRKSKSKRQQEEEEYAKWSVFS